MRKESPASSGKAAATLRRKAAQRSGSAGGEAAAMLVPSPGATVRRSADDESQGGILEIETITRPPRRRTSRESRATSSTRTMASVSEADLEKMCSPRSNWIRPGRKNPKNRLSRVGLMRGSNGHVLTENVSGIGEVGAAASSVMRSAPASAGMKADSATASAAARHIPWTRRRPPPNPAAPPSVRPVRFRGLKRPPRVRPGVLWRHAPSRSAVTASRHAWRRTCRSPVCYRRAAPRG